MSNTLCAAFNKVSSDTWFRIQESRGLLHLLGEETLTDLLILDLLRQHIPDIHIEVFTKNREGKNGADWEWWFRDKSGKCVGMRVQAKVIDKSGKIFEHLHYPYPNYNKLKKSSYQCEKLIASANDEFYPLIPVYCLYTHWSSPPELISNLIGFKPTIYNQASFGCSIIAAENIRKLRMKKNKREHNRKLVDTLPYSMPLPYLLCNAHDSSNSITGKILGAFIATGTLNSAEGYLLPTLPDYIAELLENRAGYHSQVERYSSRVRPVSAYFEKRNVLLFEEK